MTRSVALKIPRSESKKVKNGKTANSPLYVRLPAKAITWSSPISLYVSLTKSTSPRFCAPGTSASLPLLSAFLINCIPGIFMRRPPVGMRPRLGPQTFSLPTVIPARGHLSNNRQDTTCEESPRCRGLARRAKGFLRDRCPRTGAAGAVSFLAGGDPILVVYRPATVRLPHPRHGNVNPADPVRLANVHLSPSLRLPTKSIPTGFEST